MSFDFGPAILAGNWMLSHQKFVNQSSFDEGFPFDNPGLVRLSYINMLQYSRTQ